jgi:hypothetical protein
MSAEQRNKYFGRRQATELVNLSTAWPLNSSITTPEPFSLLKSCFSNKKARQRLKLALADEDKSAWTTLPVVAQTGRLSYRGPRSPPFRRGRGEALSEEWLAIRWILEVIRPPTPGRLPVGDTAGCQPALRLRAAINQPGRLFMSCRRLPTAEISVAGVDNRVVQ